MENTNNSINEGGVVETNAALDHVRATPAVLAAPLIGESLLRGKGGIASDDALVKMKERGRGRAWAAFQNHDLSSGEVGSLRFLPIADGKEPFGGAGWQYAFVGWVDLEKNWITSTRPEGRP